MTDTTADRQAQPETATNARRQQILAAAETCFQRSGFHGTSMHEICQEAGMSPGALYRYFRSKDDIIIAIADEDRARNLAIFSRDDMSDDFIEHLLRMGLMFLSEMARPGAAALMAEVMAECLRNSAIGARFQANEQECRTMFRDLMRDAVARGDVEPVGDFDMAMSCLMAMAEGLVFRMAFDPSLTVDRIEPMLRQMVLALFKSRARLD